MVKRIKHFVLVIAVVTMVLNNNVYASDNPSNWAIPNIEAVKQLNVLKPSMFSKYKQPIVRKEFSYLVVKLYEFIIGEALEPTINDTFEDTTDMYVLMANGLGVIGGYGNGKFGPDDNITREQMATMLFRLGKLLNNGSNIEISKFQDDKEFSSWANEGVYYCKNLSIMNGVGNNIFNPKGTVTVEQALTIFLNAINTLTDKRVKVNEKTKEDEDVSYDAEEISSKFANAVFYIELYDKNNYVISSGSGFFINEDGRAVTNYHVINGAYSAKIQLTTGEVYDVSTVAYIDIIRDIAIINIDADRKFDYLNMGDTSTIKSGQKIYALGSPQGLSNTISEGIVSNARRTIKKIDYIQITAPISPGSSGGALIDDKGYVIGVTTANITGGQNLNLAIPIERAKKDIDSDATLSGIWESDGRNIAAPLEDELPFYEVEPNSATPNFVENGSTIFGTFHYEGDVDVFEFQANYPAKLYASAFVGNADNTNIITIFCEFAIFDQDDNVLATGVYNQDTTEYTIEGELSPGNYRLVILGASGYEKYIVNGSYLIYFALDYSDY